MKCEPVQKLLEGHCDQQRQGAVRRWMWFWCDWSLSYPSYPFMYVASILSDPVQRWHDFYQSELFPRPDAWDDLRQTAAKVLTPWHNSGTSTSQKDPWSWNYHWITISQHHCTTGTFPSPRDGHTRILTGAPSDPWNGLDHGWWHHHVSSLVRPRVSILDFFTRWDEIGSQTWGILTKCERFLRYLGCVLKITTPQRTRGPRSILASWSSHQGPNSSDSNGDGPAPARTGQAERASKVRD